MKKLLTRIALAAGTLGVIVGGAAAFSAFEAHVINVTATIENALSVDTTAIEFGTVFPQEFFAEDFINVALSESFLQQRRLDDVKYVIKQKVKVKPNEGNPEGDPYAIIQVDDFAGPAWQYCDENLPVGAPYNLTEEDLEDLYWDLCYLPLANYLSKHEVTEDDPENDEGVYAFHQAYTWDNGTSTLNEFFFATGELVQTDGDIVDSWLIDLAVPCFVNQCAQDWDEFVDEFDGNNDADPNAFMLATSTEHEVFGTDLWIEVYDYSPLVD